MMKIRLMPVVLVMFLLLGTTSALPHASLVRASPPVNSTVQNAPREVAILFNERVQAPPGAIAVQDASGARVDEGDARLDSNGLVIRASLKPLTAGTYKVNWRIRSADGHTAEGSFTFRVRR
jgi:methionine-rich copper-binding protein CopC